MYHQAGITETAMANDLNPFRYLKHVLTVLNGHQNDRECSFIEDILPWSEELPELCWSKAKATLLKTKFYILGNDCMDILNK